MTWQLCENQSIAVLDQSMVERLSAYLQGREAHLSYQIIQAIQLLEGIPFLPKIEGSGTMHLDEAIEEFSRRVNRITHAPKPNVNRCDWDQIIDQVNEGLWGYVEILEGCVTELFQQVDRICFEHWDTDLVHSATLIRDELTHRMDDLIWAILRLEQQLKRYWKICQIPSSGWLVWRQVSTVWKKLLDRSIVSTVQKCRKFLNFRYGKFVARYASYLHLQERAQELRQDLGQLRVLGSLDLDHQDKFKQMFYLLTLWKLNNRAMVLSSNEVVRALRGCASYEVLFEIYKEYLTGIRTALFDKSRMIKKQYRLLFMDIKVRQPLLESILDYHQELQVLRSVITEYKEFHLETDPPKKTWKQRLLGEAASQREAKHCKELQHLLESICTLDALALDFHASMEREPAMEKKVTSSMERRVASCLHEMAQPLASRELMQSDAKELLTTIKGLDEMGAFDPLVVDFVRRTFVKAMCADWKYHVMQEIPLFHQLYEIHQGVGQVEEDRFHLNRMHKFRCILDRLKGWVENNETLQRAHEIELNIGDIKACFQDFFAQVQRAKAVSSEEQGVHQDFTAIYEALLQYMYLFGQFFHLLKVDVAEHRLLRKKLLFVDQYFEEIERKLGQC